ncbi:uncharacterized protein LOC124924695 [Impatiens glandulifera]|uniref:uncharacterized protein LOC124924695 n=1 Tax=Impatiens glandulifera TaxID=253017 RepID=UPI001FB0E31E|nr:uncharacterized protein LOC124924695 [Impatiens glandulifera]
MGSKKLSVRLSRFHQLLIMLGVQDSGDKAADFDNDDGGGLLNGVASGQQADQQTVTLPLPMNGQAAIPAALLPTIVVSEPIGIYSECLLFKNMFDPAMEMDPKYDLEIKDDVEAECSKYGTVLHIHVDKNSVGYVYLRFKTIQASAAAQATMHKRWFAHKMISAVFLHYKISGLELGISSVVDAIVSRIAARDALSDGGWDNSMIEQAHPIGVTSVSWAPSIQKLVSGECDNTVKV